MFLTPRLHVLYLPYELISPYSSSRAPMLTPEIQPLLRARGDGPRRPQQDNLAAPREPPLVCVGFLQGGFQLRLQRIARRPPDAARGRPAGVRAVRAVAVRARRRRAARQQPRVRDAGPGGRLVRGGHSDVPAAICAGEQVAGRGAREYLREHGVSVL